MNMRLLNRSFEKKEKMIEVIEVNGQTDQTEERGPGIEIMTEVTGMEKSCSRQRDTF